MVNLIDVLGISVCNVRMEQAMEMIQRRLNREFPSQFCFLNADCVNLTYDNPEYRDTLTNDTLMKSVLCFADGSGVGMAARMRGLRFVDNVNGTDMLPHLCRLLEQTGKGIFLFGARPGVAQGVAEWMQRNYPRIVVSGHQHGYVSAAEEAAVIERIARSGASVLLVAMGAPRQDVWISRHLAELGVSIAMGVGGLFDFYSGRIDRAPVWIRRMGMEWTFRMMKEPARLWRRYVLGNPLFLARAAFYPVLSWYGYRLGHRV